MSKIIQIIKDLTPPLLLRAYARRDRANVRFSGSFETWNEAANMATGYDSDYILNKVKEAALRVKHREAAYERDSVVFEKLEYNFPLLAALLRVASVKGNELRVLDFGGSLGSLYFQCRGFLADLHRLKWCIVEQEKFVACGQQFFAGDELSFFYTIKECRETASPDVIVLSSVLQYLESPYSFLAELIQQKFEYIFVDRTPCLSDLPDRLTLQTVPASIYEASYPAWFFNLDKFTAALCGKYEILAEFDSFESWDLGDAVAQNKGFMLKRKSVGGT